MSTSYSLAGARVILTGASSGIGWALAKELANAKSRLVVAARSETSLRRLADVLRTGGTDVCVVPTDIADAAQRKNLVNEAARALGGVDILINNAGVGANGFFDQADEARLRRVMEVNFFGATELTRLALSHLKEGRQPMIVNISSIIGRRAVPGYAEYCASKFAMCGWSEALRAELVCFGIHVLLVCPGLIATPFRNNLLEDRVRFPSQMDGGMNPRQCARKIIYAIRKRRNELNITFGGKSLVFLNKFAPRLVDWLMAIYAKSGTPIQPPN